MIQHDLPKDPTVDLAQLLRRTLDLRHDASMVYAERLMATAGELHRAYVSVLNERQKPWHVFFRTAMEDNVQALCKGLGLTCELDDDARGYAVRLHGLKDRHGRVAGNTMGGDTAGWGIGWS